MESIFFDYFLFYFLVAALQGFILSSIIVFQKPIKKPAIFLGILLFLFSLSLLHHVLEESIHAFNSRFPIPMNFSLTYGPIAYFHIKAITSPKFRADRRIVIHFIPSFLIEVLFFIGFFTYVHFHMDWAYANIENIQLLFLLIGIISFVHMTVYAYYMYRLTNKLSFRPEETAKTIGSWLRTFAILWALLTLFLGTTIVVGIVNIRQLGAIHVQYPLSALASICIYWLGYRYLLKYSPAIQKYVTRVSIVKYSPKEAEEKKKQLVEMLEIKKVYTDESLNLETLARHMGWPARDLSMMISEMFGTNFNDLINSYRIDAFKELAGRDENRKYTMFGLARQVGFTSKASFYRAFKKVCGQTPGEFLDGSPPE